MPELLKRFIYYILPLLCLCFFSACSSTRVLPSPFEDARAAAAERFALNEWYRDGTRESVVKKDTKDCYRLRYYEWEFPEVKIRCDLEVRRRPGNISKLYVYVKDYHSWFSPFTYSPSKARAVISEFERRLESGTWGPMPWKNPYPKEIK